jgi:PTH1 family peptidyl-tRNA hydrolase
MSSTPTLIVGLGNPGPRYENTKHNIGFWVVNLLLERLGVNRLEHMCYALVARSEWRDGEVIFAKPLTYVNDSGRAVKALVQRFNVPVEQICAVYDDFNLEIGVLRIRKSGSDGGHNGMKSIIQRLGTQEFPRLRIGIGKAPGNWKDYVLSEFSPKEKEQIGQVIQRAADAVETFITDGVLTAMNRFNGRIEGVA